MMSHDGTPNSVRALAFIVLGAAIGIAGSARGGGAGVGPRAEVVGLCAEAESICGDARCYLNECEANECPSSGTFCEEALAAFTGQLIISVDDQPPIDVIGEETPACGDAGGTTTATVTLLARKADGSTFAASGTYSESTPPPCNPCSVPDCVVDDLAFFCSTSGVTRLTETAFLDPSNPFSSWLLMHSFPGDIRGAILEQFPGVVGEPVIVRVAETSRTDHSGSGDALPTEVRFCIKVHLAPVQL